MRAKVNYLAVRGAQPLGMGTRRKIGQTSGDDAALDASRRCSQGKLGVYCQLT